MKPVRELRIDLGDLKARIVKRIGAERSKRYFYHLNTLLSQKLSKSGFNKLCFRLLGRENLPLHNQLIHAILKNACLAKVPPTTLQSGPPQLLVVGGKSSLPNEDRHGLSSGSGVPAQVHALSAWSNGVVFPVSPRMRRPALRHRKLRDRPVSLGPNGEVGFSSHQPMTMEAGRTKMSMENGELTPCDYQKPLQNLKGLAEKLENERGVSIQQSAERQRTSKSSDLPPSLHGNDQIGAAVVEDKDQVEQDNHLNLSRSLLIAPLGIPRCSASIGGAHRPVKTARYRNYCSYFGCGRLCETETLKKQMERIAEAQGLGGVSMSCANLLNNTVDVYLKMLIKSCVELVESKSLHGPRNQQISGKQSIQAKPINGLWPTNHYRMQSSGGPAEFGQEQKIGHTISFLDFKVAMELNPHQLGGDWPLLLEKICMHGFKE